LCVTMVALPSRAVLGDEVVLSLSTVTTGG
jgi:hypothetical protein